MDSVEIAVGRGRGRGGVALISQDIWEAKEHRDEDFSSTEPSSNPSSESEHSGFFSKSKGNNWNCPSCDNVNWPWRSSCNKCGIARPKSLRPADGVRSGSGGGFNERQTRASKSAVEVDDDGYDDFGRLNKNLKIDRRQKELAALNRLKQSYGFLMDPESVDNVNPVDSTSKYSNRDIDVRKSHSANDNDTKPSLKPDRNQDKNSDSRSDDKSRHSRNSKRSRSRSKDRDHNRVQHDSRQRSRSRSRSRDRNKYDERRKKRSRSNGRRN